MVSTPCGDIILENFLSLPNGR